MTEVVLERVSVNNERGLPVLMGVNAVIKAGESVAIIGRNGSGKTILLRTMAGLWPVRGGKVRIDNKDLAPLDYRSRQALRMRIGFVMELDGLAANLTVEDNLRLPMGYHSDHEWGKGDHVKAIADELGISHALDERASAANASVRKRALYAQALVTEPALLVVDQPLRGLSQAEAEFVCAAVERRREARGMTVVYASDDGRLEPFVVKRRLYLEKGMLSATESPALRTTGRISRSGS